MPSSAIVYARRARDGFVGLLPVLAALWLLLAALVRRVAALVLLPWRAAAWNDIHGERALISHARTWEVMNAINAHSRNWSGRLQRNSMEALDYIRFTKRVVIVPAQHPLRFLRMLAEIGQGGSKGPGASANRRSCAGVA